MTETVNIKQLVAEVIQTAQADMYRGADALTTLSNNYNFSRSVQLDVIKLKRAINSGKISENLAVKQICDLAETIGLNYDGRQSNTEVKTALAEVRNSFLQQLPEYPIAAECIGVTKRYFKPDFEFAPFSFVFRAGEITGVVGENGNGKSTFLKMLGGEIKPDGGEVRYPMFASESDNNFWALVKQKIAFLPQEFPRLPPGTVRQIISFVASAAGITGTNNDDETNFIIHRLGLGMYADTSWSILSGGYKLRLMLACSLIRKPKMLILDEPLANLDINAQLVLLNDLRDIANNIDNPVCIILSSQHLEQVETVANNMIVVQRGKIIFSDKMERIGELFQYNTFELKCRLTRDEMRSALEGLDYMRVSSTGFSYIITTPLEVTSDYVIDHLQHKQVTIRYFNDISRSTRRIILNVNN